MRNLFLAILTLTFSTSVFAVANTVKDISNEVTDKAQNATQAVTDKTKEAVNSVTPDNKDIKTPATKEENKVGEKL